MKKIRTLYRLILAALFLTLVSCKNETSGDDLLQPSSDTSLKGLFAYAEHPERGRDTLDLSFTDALDGILFTTRALPEGAPEVDLTRVRLEVEVAKGATTNLDPEQPVDLSHAGNRLIVTAEDGIATAVYTLQAVVTPPYPVLPEYRTVLTELWTKSGPELELRFPNSCRSLAVAGHYLLVLDNPIDYSADAKIKAYDKQTGRFVKDIPVYEGGWAGPRSYSWTLAADEAGHFAMGRLNSGGAGFWLDVYEHIDALPVNPFKLAGDQVPENAGKRMQILGNLFSGESQVYLTAAHFYGDLLADGQYCFWSLIDGVPSSVLPDVFNYGVKWQSAVVERASLDDPTLFVTYNDETGYPNDPFDSWEQLHAARFEMFVPGSGDRPLSIDPENFKYRLLDSKVFGVKDARYLFTLQQGYSTGTGEMCARLYDLTDRSKFGMKPGEAGYDGFLLYESAPYVSRNDLRYGNVAVQVDRASGIAYLYVFYPGSDTADAKITALKMEVTEK